MPNALNVISFSLAKNEEDVIEAFVRQNLRYIDHMYIADNLSTDGTRDILNALVEEGLPITVLDDPEQGHQQNLKTTKAYQELSATVDFDAIFFIDADEFLCGSPLVAPEGKYPGKFYHVERERYVITDPASNEPNVLRRMQYKLVEPETNKSMIFHDRKAFAKVSIGTGNHHVYRAGKRKVHGVIPGLKLAHFPIRSKRQFLSKMVLGWVGLMLRDQTVRQEEKPQGSHWRDGYQFFMKYNGSISDDRFMRRIYKTSDFDAFKASLVFDPLQFDFELKYVHLMQNKSLISLVLMAYEKTIDSLWDARVKLGVESTL